MVVELKLRMRTIDLPYTVRIQDVSEELFDELVDEDTKAELLDGVMIVPSPASPRHDNVAGFLRTLMRVVARKKKRGLVLGPDSLIHLATCRKFGPDICFFEQHRVPRPLPRKQFEDVPDLIVEVLSPSNREVDLEEKRPAYQEAGVGELWFVDPDAEEVIVDRRKSKKKYATTTYQQGKVTSGIIAGFWVDASWLWADELPDELECLEAILK